MHDHFHVQSARFGARALIAIGVAAALIAACQPAPATPVAQPPSQPEVRPTQPPAQPQTPAATSGIPAPFNDPSARPRVALVRELSSGSFFERYLAGAQAQARELGIELLVSSAEGDQAKLVANLETAIAQRVDAIIIDHGRGDVVRPTVQKALEAGIKVVTFDVQINLPEVPEIEQDDLLIGLLAARQLAIDSGGAGEVVYVNVNGFAPLDKRDRSWQDIKWRYPDLKEVARIGRVSANTAADTQTQFEAVIKSNPEARLVLAMYDEFAKGAVRAIEQAGLSDKYRVYSVDITNDDIQMMVKPGSPWKATVATDSYAVGRLSVRAAAALIAGEKVERYLLVQPVVITQEFLRANNVQDMD
ncbi:MAG: substrate-binding domain-containing protein, partial [Thermoflexales bacterium]|nr:substrate-binding domain-containing protein [Thermoflexales bacterium]